MHNYTPHNVTLEVVGHLGSSVVCYIRAKCLLHCYFKLTHFTVHYTFMDVFSLYLTS